MITHRQALQLGATAAGEAQHQAGTAVGSWPVAWSPGMPGCVCKRPSLRAQGCPEACGCPRSPQPAQSRPVPLPECLQEAPALELQFMVEVS